MRAVFCLLRCSATQVFAWVHVHPGHFLPETLVHLISPPEPRWSRIGLSLSLNILPHRINSVLSPPRFMISNSKRFLIRGIANDGDIIDFRRYFATKCYFFSGFLYFANEFSPVCTWVFTAIYGLPSSESHFLCGGRTESSRLYFSRK